MKKAVREITCENEHLLLSRYASFADKSRGRLRKEEECEIRTCFQRDRDRIIHCNSFRRLSIRPRSFFHPRAIITAQDLLILLRSRRLQEQLP